jgi:signal transduction histidine kinase
MKIWQYASRTLPTPNWLTRSLGAVRDWLFKPSGRVKDPGDLIQASLTAALTFFFTLLISIGAVMTKNPVGRILLLAMAMVTLVSYGLSRTRYFRMGGFVLLCAWTITSLGYVYLEQTDFGAAYALMLFVPLGFIMGMTLVRLHSLALLVLVNLAGVVLLPVFDPTVGRSIISTVGVLFCLGGLTLITRYHWNDIEQHRLQALTEANLQLQVLHTNLEQANQVLENRLQELEAKNAELERFTYTVSHDLKSPLVTINGFLGYLEKDTASGDMERAKHDSQRIKQAVDKMKLLLDELLELSRIGRLMNPSKTIWFESLTREALEIVCGQLEAHKVTVIVQPNLPTVYGDRQRLTEILQNLIDNAAKFMGEQQDPKIEIGCKEQDGKSVFFVKDNGIGIDPKFHEQIFGLFNKLDPHVEGTGVGLALVKRIVEVHGGKIWVESEGMSKGTTFYRFR